MTCRICGQSLLGAQGASTVVAQEHARQHAGHSTVMFTVRHVGEPVRTIRIRQLKT